MPRARIELGAEWRQKLADSIEPEIVEALKLEPLAEPEIFASACSALGAGQSPREIAASLRRMYSLQFRRGISESTALVSVLSHLRKVVSFVKKRLLEEGYAKAKYGVDVKAVGREIRFGHDYHGRIFYCEGAEGKLREKAGALIMAHPESCAAEILSAISRRGYVFASELKSQKRAIDLAAGLLGAYGLAARGVYEGREMLHEPGFSAQAIGLAKEAGPPATGLSGFFGKTGFRVWENFRCGTWTLTAEGPKVVRLGFRLVAFDPENFQLHIADSSGNKRADISRLRALRRKVRDWGLPAALHFFAPGFTPSAEKYASKWGIRLHTGTNSLN